MTNKMIVFSSLNRYGNHVPTYNIYEHQIFINNLYCGRLDYVVIRICILVRSAKSKSVYGARVAISSSMKNLLH